MAQADAEDGHLAQHAANAVLGVVQRLGVAGAVAEKHAVGLVRQHFLGRRRAGQDRHAAAFVAQMPGDVPLHAVVEGDDVKVGLLEMPGSPRPAAWPSLTGRRPTRAAASGITSRTRSRPTRPGLALAFATRLASSRSTLESTPFIAPRGAQPADEGPRVDAREADDAVPLQISVERFLRAEVARPLGEFLDDEAGQVGLAAFDVLGVDAVVADLGVGHRHDLPAIARIGEDFLIAGHRRVEADFAIDLAGGAERGAGEDRAVFQGKLCGLWSCRHLATHHLPLTCRL